MNHKKYLNFNDSKTFATLEDKAIDGVLDYENFPPVEYKYFSRLSKLGYLNRHSGWDKNLCQEKQKDLLLDYKEEKADSEKFLNLSKRIQENIKLGNELNRKIYTLSDKDEILDCALLIIELIANENGFSDRIHRRIKE